MADELNKEALEEEEVESQTLVEAEEELEEEFEEEEPEEEEKAEEEPEGEFEEEEVKKPAHAKKESVPLSKYISERKRRQEAERVLTGQQIERDRMKLVQQLIDRGWPEDEAQVQAQEKINQWLEIERLKDKQLDYDIRELATADEFYSDAASYKDAIKEKMRAYNVDAKEAYMLIRGRSRMRELQLQNEQRMAAKRSKIKTKKVENAKPLPVSAPYKLDDYDKKALAELQKAQPEAGWNAEKYFKTMKT